MRRPRPPRQLSLASRLAIAVIMVSAAAIATASAVGLATGTRANDRLVEQRLVAAVSAERFETRAALDRLRSQVGTVAASPSTAEAIERFRIVTDALVIPPSAELAGQRESLREHYRRSLVPILERTAGGDLDTADLVPDTPVGVHLQHAFIGAPPASAAPSAIDLPDVDPAWAQLHAEIHPVLRRTAAQLDAADLLLVDADGLVLYSVAKTADFATNLAIGPHAGGPVGAVLRQADTTAAATITELAPYAPAMGQPMWFVVAPVPLSDGTVGALVARFDLEPLHRAMGETDRTPIALGETGEVQLAGVDTRLRTDPRAFREDRSGYLDSAIAAGTLSVAEADLIEARTTSVLVARTDGDAVTAAFESGERSPVFERTDHLGRPSLIVAAPLDLAGVEWVVVAQITSDEASAPLDRYRQQLLVLTAALVVTVTFVGMAWANRLAAPLRQLADRPIDPEVDGRSNPTALDTSTDRQVGRPATGSTELGMLIERFSDLHDQLDQRRTDADHAHETWLATVRSLLPSHLVRRVDSSDEVTHDVAPAASVVVMIVHDLDPTEPATIDHVVSESVESQSGVGSQRERLAEVMAQIDLVTERRGLERVGMLGDTVVAVVGHRSPVLDHARRAALFADDLVHRSPGLSGLRLSAGVASGPVITGLSGIDRLVYDAWGPTVTAAFVTAHRAAPGNLEIDESTRHRLPPELFDLPTDTTTDTAASTTTANTTTASTTTGASR